MIAFSHPSDDRMGKIGAVSEYAAEMSGTRVGGIILATAGMDQLAITSDCGASNAVVGGA